MIATSSTSLLLRMDRPTHRTGGDPWGENIHTEGPSQGQVLTPARSGHLSGNRKTGFPLGLYPHLYIEYPQLCI